MHKQQQTSSDNLLADWRQIVVARRGRQRDRLPRGFATLGFLTHGPQPPKYVEYDKLILVVLHDDLVDPSALQLAGYAAQRVPHGIQWGGTVGRRFSKDLTLTPKCAGKGRRIDLANRRLVQLGLRLEQRLQQVTRFGTRRRSASLKLPRLWAAFHQRDALGLTGDGPEFTEVQQRFNVEPQRLLEKFQRKHFGLTLLPCDWVSHALDDAVTIYAELDGFPRRQAFRLRRPSDSLVGYQGAIAFDFYGHRGGKSRCGATAA